MSSPNPGASMTSVVWARRAISTSACPAPTVSIRMTSNPAASKTCTSPAVARANPPSEPREAIERMNTPGSPARSRIRTRSPSTAPPVNGLDGSTATMATRRSSCLRKCSASWLTSDDLPVPGAPVTPIKCALPVCEKSSLSAARPSGVSFSTCVNRRVNARRFPDKSCSAKVIRCEYLFLHGFSNLTDDIFC